MAQSTTPAVGIDLGTTYSAVATLESGRPKTLLNEEGELITPSVVFFDRSTAIVGREAIKAAEHEPERLAAFAKREMGENVFHKTICGQSFPPDVIQAIVLDKLRRDTIRHLGEFTKAVVTVPAYFNEPRRKATQDAGRMAGLDVIDIINEPTAAAIAYGVQRGFVNATGQATQHERVLVYDLGGGTFDVTLMDIRGSQFRALATAGDVYLGGVDWDTRIAEHVAATFLKEHKVDLHEDRAAWERLLHAASEAKKALTARDETVIPFAVESKKLKLKLTRGEFETLSADLLDRTRLTVRRLLKEAGLAWSDVTRLLAVGGSTRMPMVGRMLEEESNLKFDRSVSPDEAVAHGAAIYAGMLLKAGGAIDGITVSNVNSHDLGVLGVDPETRRPRRKIMIPRNTSLPTEVTKPFKTARDKQESVKVQVVEGGTDSGSNATAIGTCVVKDLPPLAAGTTIQVTFRYGQDGRLTVKASIPSISRDAHLEIERASGIPDDDIAAWADCIAAGLGVPDEEATMPEDTTLDVNAALRQAAQEKGAGGEDDLNAFFKKMK